MWVATGETGDGTRTGAESGHRRRVAIFRIFLADRSGRLR